VAFARLGLSWHDAVVVSAHARPIAWESRFEEAGKIAVLAGGEASRADCGNAGADRGEAQLVRVRKPDAAQERVCPLDPANLARWRPDGKVIVLILKEEVLRDARNVLWDRGRAGDPELMTVKGAKLLAQCRNVFVPKVGIAAQSVAFDIAKGYLAPSTCVQELTFPMTTDRAELASAWDASAGEIAIPLEAGQDACFLTLGDPMLYSTYIYLLRALRARFPALPVMTVPGITSMCAAASLAEFPIGQFKEPVTIIPAADDLGAVRQAVAVGDARTDEGRKTSGDADRSLGGCGTR
jgi:precorrin-2 C(20)-methyltransferase